MVKTTTNILKSITGGKTLSRTDMHENGLRLKVMSFFSHKVILLNENISERFIGLPFAKEMFKV